MHHAASLLRSAAPSFIQRAVTALRGSRLDSQSATLVRAFATEIQRENELATWLLQLADLQPAERSSALQRRAHQYRGAWATFGLAHTLDRLAARPALFQAVAEALHNAPIATAQFSPAALAHAA